MKRFILAAFLLCSCCAASGWSGTEHGLMAYMAEQHLTPRTKAFIARYLDQSIAQYAGWMDRYRKSPGYEQTDSWHMVSVDNDGSFATGKDGEALPKLQEAIKILSDYKACDDSTVHINLVYVIHLVPEIHCPAHYYFGDNFKPRNRQKVVIKGKTYVYHSLWDRSIVLLHHKITKPQFVGIFDTWSPEKQMEVSNGTPEDWCRDNISRIKEIYEWAQPGDVLPDDFLEQHRDLPETQARLGAYRLARLLNDLFDKAQ